MVRKFLLKLDERKGHVKYWRPQILLLSNDASSEWNLIMFCNSLKKGALYVLGHVLKGEFKECLPELRRQQISWLKLVDLSQVKAFVDVVIANDEREGARNLILSCGLGGMRPNVVVMGFPTDIQNPARLYSNEATGFVDGNSSPELSSHSTSSNPSPPSLNQGVKRDESEITIRAATDAIGKQKHRVLNLKALPTDSARRETPIKPTTYVGEFFLLLKIRERSLLTIILFVFVLSLSLLSLQVSWKTL